MFELYDIDKDGAVTLRELVSHLTYSYDDEPAAFTEGELHHIMKRADVDGSGSMDEFVKLLGHHFATHRPKKHVRK